MEKINLPFNCSTMRAIDLVTAAESLKMIVRELRSSRRDVWEKLAVIESIAKNYEVV